MYKIEEYFKRLSNPKRQAFNNRIVKTNYYIYGLTTKEIRDAIKLIDNYEAFLNNKEFNSYEMMFLYSEVIMREKDTSKIIKYLKDFLGLVDNWAIIDNLCTHLKVDKAMMLEYVLECLNDDREFIKRFGIVMYICQYLKEEYLDLFFKYFDSIDKSDYYVMMAVAWAIASTYIKYPEYTTRYLDNNHLDDITYNKALSKINDSYAVSLEDKKKIKMRRR